MVIWILEFKLRAIWILWTLEVCSSTDIWQIQHGSIYDAPMNRYHDLSYIIYHEDRQSKFCTKFLSSDEAHFYLNGFEVASGVVKIHVKSKKNHCILKNAPFGVHYWLE